MPKAVVCRELGPPERLRLETFASAPLAEGQVRVAIQAAGINFPDILMAAGEYQLKPPLPFTPGVEAAGDVVEVGGAAKGVAVGDRVIVKMRHGLTPTRRSLRHRSSRRCRRSSTTPKARHFSPPTAPRITR